MQAQPSQPTTALAKPAQPQSTPQPELVTLLQKMGPEIARALPKHVSGERMARVVLTALRMTKDLDKCTAASFLGAVMNCAQLGLEPNTPLGHAYLIPRKNRKRGSVDCTLLIGYQGMLEIARRSGEVTSVYAHPVKPGDTFTYELGLEPKLTHVPSERADRESLPLTHVYAVARVKGGDAVFVVLTKAQVDKSRARADARDSGPWVTDYEAMALKTAVRRLFRWLPKSVEMARAERLDVLAETGKPQALAYDDTITKALQGAGLEAEIDTEGEDVDDEPDSEAVEQTKSEQAVDALITKHRGKKAAPAEPPSTPKHDPTTGEVAPEDEPPMRQPGEEG